MAKDGFNSNKGNNENREWQHLANRLNQRLSGDAEENDETADVPQDLLEAATQMREWYCSFVEAGFTETQALQLISIMMMGGGKNNE